MRCTYRSLLGLVWLAGLGAGVGAEVSPPSPPPPAALVAGPATEPRPVPVVATGVAPGVVIKPAATPTPSPSPTVTLPSAPPPSTPTPVPAVAVPRPPSPSRLAGSGVQLGIDVMAADGFAALQGKRIGLLTHPAGVNREGRSTISLLHEALGVKLVALFAPEHALSGAVKAGENVDDERHGPTGLPIYSLHGKNRKPTATQLKGIDALVIDLQDIGVRSYTFNVVMRYAMDSCFTYGVEVIVLDRPNPLGGLKVDGPILDQEWMSGVGAFRIPYVHGLTMGELARMAAETPGILEVPEPLRLKGRLTVIPMRGWMRTMRWPETGLTFVPTSPLVRDFPAAVGYAMVGLGCEYSGFKHGAGKEHPFRVLSFKGKTALQLKTDLDKLKIAGLGFRVLGVKDAQGKATTALYVDVMDWAAWRPTELSFALMRLACRYDTANPFVKLGDKETRSFNIHVGSTAWWDALRKEGAQVNLDVFQADWARRCAAFQQQSKRFWLYML